MENQFKTSITAHITKLKNYYKEQSDYWEAEHKANPKLKHPKEEYIRYHWEYRAYDMLLTNIGAGYYDDKQYYEAYLRPLPSNK
jgi:hypothetical protein